MNNNEPLENIPLIFSITRNVSRTRKFYETHALLINYVHINSIYRGKIGSEYI